jgi:hypothetical protein
MEKDTTSRAPLGYAPKPAMYRRRGVRRVVLGVVVLGVAVACWWWREPVLARGRVVYWQHRCLTFEAPAERVVYEEEAGAAARLIGQGGYVDVRSNWSVGTGPAAAKPVAGYRPDAVTRFTAVAGWPAGTVRGAVVFAHERTSRTGVRRLVVVEMDDVRTQPIYSPFELRATVFEPAPWHGGAPPRVMPPTPNRMLPLSMPVSILPEVNIRMWAGQVYPADAARFTIAYEMDDRTGRGRGTIDGRLSDDGGHVKFTVRDGPAKPPAVWGSPVLPDP